MKEVLLRDREELERFAKRWVDAPIANPFSSWEFANAWLRQSPEREPFCFAVLDEQDEILALFPWFLKRDRMGVRWIVGAGENDAWYHEPFLRDPSDATEVFARVGRTLRRVRGQWDILKVDLRLPAHEGLINAMRSFGWVVEHRADWQQNPIADIGENYWKEHSLGQGKHFRRKERQLSRYQHRFIYAEEENFDSMLQGLFRQHGARWSERDWSAYHPLIRAMAQRALPRNELYLCAMEIEGRLAATDICLRHGDWAFGIICGFDPDYAKFMPGNLLYLDLVKRLQRDGVAWLNLGPGLFPYKQSKQSNHQAAARVIATHFHSLPGLAGALLFSLKHRKERPLVSN